MNPDPSSLSLKLDIDAMRAKEASSGFGQAAPIPPMPDVLAGPGLYQMGNMLIPDDQGRSEVIDDEASGGGAKQFLAEENGVLSVYTFGFSSRVQVP